jgi:hypothetical protein
MGGSENRLSHRSSCPKLGSRKIQTVPTRARSTNTTSAGGASGPMPAACFGPGAGTRYGEHFIGLPSSLEALATHMPCRLFWRRWIKVPQTFQTNENRSGEGTLIRLGEACCRDFELAPRMSAIAIYLTPPRAPAAVNRRHPLPWADNASSSARASGGR